MAGPVLNKGAKHYYAPVVAISTPPTVAALVQILNVRSVSGMEKSRSRVDVTDIDEPSTTEQSLPGFSNVNEITIMTGRNASDTVRDAILTAYDADTLVFFVSKEPDVDEYTYVAGRWSGVGLGDQSKDNERTYKYTFLPTAPVVFNATLS